jgi:phosphoenolpyruvate carboxylase
MTSSTSTDHQGGPGAALRERLDLSADEAGGLEARLRVRLRAQLEVAHANPFMNPLLMAALEISRLIDQREVTLEVLAPLVRRLSVRCIADRVDRSARYLEDTDIASNEARIKTVLRHVAGDGPIPFEAFRAIVERPSFGIVLTAHPTFGSSVELARAVMGLATGQNEAGEKLDKAALASLVDAVIADSHLPPDQLTLSVEHVWSLEASVHIQDALDRAAAVTLEVARDLYPNEWTRLEPRLATAASWVGYDLDGRADISWTDTFVKRLEVKRVQLRRQADRLGAIRASDPELPDALATVEDRLIVAAAAVERQIALIEATAKSAQVAGELAQTFLETREAALTRTDALRAVITEAIEAAPDGPSTLALCVFRAGLAEHGLGLSHTHVRLNASQLHNSIRKHVGMETAPNDPSRRRSYMASINDLLLRVQPETVNFASLIAERASAKRLFMTVQQMVKYVDAETPVRFLIAETEAGFTLLTALYFARLFGVEDAVEISPLFETADAIEHGDSILDDALRSPHYRAYVKRLGRLAVQFGFSDSGRYLGQMAATFQIERLRLRIVSVMERHDLGDVQLVLFNTHGESIGRGGHPGSLTDRIRYVSPPVTRAAFAERKIALKEEVSFQGGDGYHWFMGVPASLAVLRAGIEAVLLPDPEAENDPVYAASDYAVEFFAAIRQAFGRLVEDPNYVALLGAFGGNLTPRTGSRPVRRQQEGGIGAVGIAHVSQLRAIPNNTILQQMGLMANTLYGVGAARARDPETFDFLSKRSHRFRRAMEMVTAALAVSDLEVLKSYVDTFDPGVWLARSGHARKPGRAADLRTVATSLEALDLHPALTKLYRTLADDFLLLTAAVQEAPPPFDEAADERRETLLLLHTVRLALIHRIYLLAVHVPEFSPTHGLLHEDVIAALLRLDVPPTIAMLRRIFSRGEADMIPESAQIEPASYRGDAGQSYAREHSTLFDPIANLHRLILEIGSAIGTQIGAVG